MQVVAFFLADPKLLVLMQQILLELRMLLQLLLQLLLMVLLLSLLLLLLLSQKEGTLVHSLCSSH